MFDYNKMWIKKKLIGILQNTSLSILWPLDCCCKQCHLGLQNTTCCHSYIIFVTSYSLIIRKVTSYR